jgi:MtN3 and saliva related transmembrane protein
MNDERKNVANLVIGFTALVIGMSYRFPQIYRIWKRKSADDISLVMYWIQNVSYILYLTYGVRVNDYVYIISSIIAMLQNFTIMGLYFFYKERTKENLEQLSV